MDELGFRTWLSQKGRNKKVQSDCISRLKRIENALAIDLDQKYSDSKLEDVMKVFLNMGVNEEMAKYGNVSLPVGKYYMSTYRHSLKQYIQYKQSI